MKEKVIPSRMFGLVTLIVERPEKGLLLCGPLKNQISHAPGYVGILAGQIFARLPKKYLLPFDLRRQSGNGRSATRRPIAHPQNQTVRRSW